jgi:IPT/TIG domain
MLNSLRCSVLLTLLVALWPSQLVATPPSYCSSYPATIESITPQAGIAGVTQVYVLGTCFGDSQGTGSVKINGTPADVSTWSDGEIVFTVPVTATTGNLVVTSDSDGYDSSAKEADCANAGWCGTANINADFSVTAPNSPSFFNTQENPPGFYGDGTPTVPEYITAEWSYDTGFDTTGTYDLTQQSQNSDGTWPVTGSVHIMYGSPDDNCEQSVTGTLDGSGHLFLDVAAEPDQGCDSYSEEYLILSSGDITSQGYFYFDGQQPPLDFPKNLGDESDDFPLFSNIHQFPDGEAPQGVDWNSTQAEFFRTMPASGDFIPYAGRFVWE